MIERQYYKPRVCISIIIGLLTLITYPYLLNLVHNIALTNFLIISFISCILIFLNYNLLILHINRAKLSNYKIKYTLFAFICGLIILLINHFIVKGFVPVIDDYILTKYIFLSPIVIFTFSFSYIFSYTLLYKIITDKIKFEHNRKLTIIITTTIFALLLGLFLPTLFTSLLNNFIFYLAIFLVISIIYDKTNNLFIGMLGISFSFLLYNILSLISF